MVRLHFEFMPDGSPYPSSQGEAPPDGSVYFFQSGSSNGVKIGATRRPIEKRRVQLQSGNPEKLQVLCVCTTSDLKRLEKYLHAHFAAYRIHDEWFALPDEFCAVLRPEGAP
jgi:hypothetical protein